jgi:hypothetical protein
MADTHKVLGQSNPSAATLTDAYTVPSATGVIISSVVVANRSGTPTSFRVAISPNGAADNNAHYVAYDVPIAGNDVVPLVLGITLDATDVVRVYATLATLTFSIFGVEITA